MSNNKPNPMDQRLANYVEVNERIMEFWSKYPNGRIHTEIVSWQDSVIVMKASVYKDIADTLPAAVGHAYEREGSTPVNRSSVLENCETSAVGRATAILGLSIKRSIASKEEVANAIKQQEEYNTEPDRLNDPAIKSKWQLLAGNLDEYETNMQKLRLKGMTWAQIEAVLTDKLKKKTEEQK
jgi:hypothetical protein